MEIVTIDDYDFIKVKLPRAVIVFSTAKNNLDFNIISEEGRKNLENIKSWFNVNEVGFLKQIHSNYVFNYNGEINEGDALITNQLNTAIGIFNADCVPIMIYDNKNRICASVHSGWKGTLYKVVIKTIEKMEQEYNSNTEDMIIYIGPHNRSCCYEVGRDLIDLFKEDELYRGIEIKNKDNLNIEVCIKRQLQYKGVLNSNIHSLNICTYCNNDLTLHSYRKNKQSYGRMFSFIYMED